MLESIEAEIAVITKIAKDEADWIWTFKPFGLDGGIIDLEEATKPYRPGKMLTNHQMSLALEYFKKNVESALCCKL